MFTERKECPLCQSTEFEQIYEHKTDESYCNFVTSLFHNYIHDINIPDYVLYKCNNCSTIFQKYIFLEEYEYNFYANVFSKLPQFINDKDNKDCYYFATKELDIINMLITSKDCYILDFGAMYGQFEKFIHNYNYTVDSYDIMADNDQYVNILNDNYDIIRTKDTLSHIQNNLNIVINDLIKRLKKNGYFIIIDYFTNECIDYSYTTKALLPFWHTQIFDINSFTKLGLKIKMEIPFMIGNHQILDMKVDKDTRYVIYEKITK